MKNFSIILILSVSIFSFILSCNDIQEMNDPCDSAIELNSIETFDSFVGESNGSIRVNASSRNGSSSFSIDGQNFQKSSDFNGLSTGTYTIYVKDELNCEIQATAEIGSMLPMSYSVDIVPILQNNCMVSGCHCDGNSLCWDNYELVSSYAAEIRKRTSEGNMPPSYSGIFLSSQDIQKIADWVKQGALNN